MLAIGRQDTGAARGSPTSSRRSASATGSRRLGPAGALMALCYAGRGRSTRRVRCSTSPHRDPAVDAMRYGQVDALDAGPAAGAAGAEWRPGRRDRLRATTTTAGSSSSREQRSRAGSTRSGAWRIGALRATGRTQRALELYEADEPAGTVPLRAGRERRPEVLIDAGRRDEARRRSRAGALGPHERHVMFRDERRPPRRSSRCAWTAIRAAARAALDDCRA